MRTLLVLLCLLYPLGLSAFFDGAIIYTSRKLRLSASEPIPPKDFYVNGGTRQGIQIGDVLTVRRLLTTQDAHWNGLVHVMTLPLGQLKVIAVGETVSIARVEGVSEAGAVASLQYSGFMIGDTVQKTGLPSGPGIP